MNQIAWKVQCRERCDFKLVLNDGGYVGLCVPGVLFKSSGRTWLSIFLTLSIILALIEVVLNLNLDV